MLLINSWLFYNSLICTMLLESMLDCLVVSWFFRRSSGWNSESCGFLWRWWVCLVVQLGQGAAATMVQYWFRGSRREINLTFGSGWDGHDFLLLWNHYVDLNYYWPLWNQPIDRPSRSRLQQHQEVAAKCELGPGGAVANGCQVNRQLWWAMIVGLAGWDSLWCAMGQAPKMYDQLLATINND